MFTDPPQTLRDIFPTIRWVFPSAPRIPSERTGQIAPHWFETAPTTNPDDEPDTQVPGLLRSLRVVRRVLQEQQQYIPPEKIFLGGLGHGFAAAYPAYFLGREFGGLIGLSTWAPMGALSKMRWNLAEIFNIVEQQERITPVFLSHTRDDRAVPLKYGRRLCEILSTQTRAVVKYCEYESGGTQIDEPCVIDDLALFLQRSAMATL